MTLPIGADGAVAAPAARLGPWRRGVREIGLAMITAGVIVLAFLLYQLFGTSLTEQRDQSRLAQAFHQAERVAGRVHGGGVDGSTVGGGPGGGGNAGGATGGSLSPSTPTGVAVAHLVIPRIGVDKFVVQGTGEQQLAQGPGHYVGTPMPGQAGNVGIAGHRTTYGAPFFDLDHLGVGNPIYLTVTSGRTFVYRVTASRVVSPGDIAVLDATTSPTLTLTTCTPRFTATSRLVVTAALVGRPPPAPTTGARTATTPTTTTPTTTAPTTDTPTTAVPAAGAALASSGLASGNPAAWPPTIGWGVGFLALWIATRVLTARTRRWRRAGTFVAGSAVCLVPLWFCFENVVRLLPASV